MTGLRLKGLDTESMGPTTIIKRMWSTWFTSMPAGCMRCHSCYYLQTKPNAGWLLVWEPQPLARPQLLPLLWQAPLSEQAPSAAMSNDRWVWHCFWFKATVKHSLGFLGLGLGFRELPTGPSHGAAFGGPAFGAGPKGRPAATASRCARERAFAGGGSSPSGASFAFKLGSLRTLNPKPQEST